MDLNVKNANYSRVLAVLERFLKKPNRKFCSCPRCIEDVAVLALNCLPPHYYVNPERGEESGSPWVMVETAVDEAIDRVVENPHHRLS